MHLLQLIFAWSELHLIAKLTVLTIGLVFCEVVNAAQPLTNTDAALADFNAGLEAYKRKDYATAFRELKPLAERGDVRAQDFVEVMYTNGEGVGRDYEEARKWFRMAAAQGDDAATLWLKAIKGKRNTLPTWLLRLSLVQLVKFLMGVVLAFVLVVRACKILEHIPVAAKGRVAVCRTAWIWVVHLGAFALVLLAYLIGAAAAYRVATKLGDSADSALINGFYSWLYVGWKFIAWMTAHRNDPIGQAVTDFCIMMRM